MSAFTRTLWLALACCTAVPAVTQAREATYPDRPLRIVVPYPAGGASDFVARLIGERMTREWGQPVVVENRTGASGSLGAGEVARAAPDGYTLLVTIGDALINNQLLFKDLPYQPDRDFAFISQFVHSPAILSASTQLGVKDLAGLEQLARQPGQKLSYGSWGVGSLGHLAGAALDSRLAADMVHVPQRGESLVMTDLLGGTVSVGLTSAGLAKQHIAAGKIVPLGIMGPDRVPGMESIPTIREAGFDDPMFDAAVWIGVLAPAGTPQPVLDRVAGSVTALGADPQVAARLLDRGLIVSARGPLEFRQAFDRDADVILARMKQLGIEAQ